VDYIAGEVFSRSGLVSMYSFCYSDL